MPSRHIFSDDEVEQNKDSEEEEVNAQLWCLLNKVFVQGNKGKACL